MNERKLFHPIFISTKFIDFFRVSILTSLLYFNFFVFHFFFTSKFQMIKIEKKDFSKIEKKDFFKNRKKFFSKSFFSIFEKIDFMI